MKCLQCERNVKWEDIGFRYEDIFVCKDCHNKQEEFMDRNQGIKQDSGKPRWELVPMKALEGIALVMQDAIEPTEQFPEGRYEIHSWQKVDPRRYLAALVRHVTELQAGQMYTDDTHQRVIDAILTNAMFLSWFLQRGYDIRKLVPEGEWDVPDFMVSSAQAKEDAAYEKFKAQAEKEYPNASGCTEEESNADWEAVLTPGPEADYPDEPEVVDLPNFGRAILCDTCMTVLGEGRCMESPECPTEEEIEAAKRLKAGL